MGIVKYVKISQQDYDSLSVKDEDSIYAVNSTGDFSEMNLDSTARLYIGEKEIYIYKGMPIVNISPNGDTALNTDVKYVINIYNDVNFILIPDENTDHNHRYKLTMNIYNNVPTITFPTNLLWVKPLTLTANSKYIIVIEDGIAMYVKVALEVNQSFSNDFSDDFIIFMED